MSRCPDLWHLARILNNKNTGRCIQIYTHIVTDSVYQYVMVLPFKNNIFMLSVPDTTERSEETIQLGIIVGSSVGGVVLIAALLTCCVCLIVSWRIHAHAKIDRTIVKVVVFKHYEGNSPDEMEEELEKYFKQKRVTDDGGDEEAQRQKAQEEAQKQTILDKFIKDMHKRRC